MASIYPRAAKDAVAFEALSRIHPFQVSGSLRDIPLEQRERLLLEWLAAYDAHVGEDKSLGPILYELYTDAAHVQLGRLLVERWWQSWEQRGRPRPAEWPPGSFSPYMQPCETSSRTTK